MARDSTREAPEAGKLGSHGKGAHSCDEMEGVAHVMSLWELGPRSTELRSLSTRSFWLQQVFKFEDVTLECETKEVIADCGTG